VTIAALVERAELAGIRLTAANYKLTYEAPKTTEADAILTELRQHRLEVAAYLRRPRDPMEAGETQPQNWRRFDALVRLAKLDHQRRGLPP
jgi:hypothetical protein